MAHDPRERSVFQRPITRRHFLKGTAGAAVAAPGVSTILAACTESSSSTPSATSTATAVRRGGTLRAAITGGSSSDTLNPLGIVSNTDNARISNLFEGLIGQDPQALPQLLLAEEVTPNSDATAWTIRVRQGVTFHNGKDLTADDVIYSFRLVMNPKSPGPGASSLESLDVGAMRKLDKYTVQVPCKAPFAILDQILAPVGVVFVVPVDFDPRHPVGTGPFKLDSFTPGTQSTFAKNNDYWQTGLPYVDELVITDFSDETSQVNALLAGQVDVVNLLSAAIISEVESEGKKVLISPGGGWNPFTIRVDRPPFNDVRVRQAMRLIADRKQMLDLIFGGHGTIGNDVFGIWAPDYDRSIPQREQDIPQARSLLKAAGQDEMTVELVTADIAQGVVKAAQVFAQQATAAGIKVNLRQLDVSGFYGTNYLKWVFAQDYWYYSYYLPQVASSTLPTSIYNETHFNDSEYNSLYAQALATVDTAKRYELEHEMQMIDYTRGGYIIPFFPPVIDGYAPNVQGLVPSKAGISLDGYKFKELWLA
jgi:peptide/nickel transport system substrate-binding protein